jgi:hypothetical protein
MIKEKYIEFKGALANKDITKAEEVFTQAYNKAVEIVNEKITAKAMFDTTNEEELYAVLVIFDNMIGFWNEGMFDEAYKVCNDMYILVDNPKLKEMFKLFSYGLDNEIDINTFIKEYVDLSKVDSEFPMFLVNFQDKITELFPPKDD